MKQIIRTELAKKLGIINPDLWSFLLVENGMVQARWNNNDETIQRLDNGEEYIGNDRSKLVDWKEQERWFLWQYGKKWSLDHYPSNKTLAGHQVNDLIPILDRSTNDPNHYTELSKAEAEYILAKPDSEGWELRAPVAGDSVEVARGCLIVIYSLSDAQRVNKDTINGLRWCKRPALVPWTMEDVPPVCWIREKSSKSAFLMRGVTTEAILVRSVYITFERLAEAYEWSADLKNWKSCTKEQ